MPFKAEKTEGRKDRSKIKKELAFLSKEKQKAYLDELHQIYNRMVKDI